jgi:hypothetical protein
MDLPLLTAVALNGQVAPSFSSFIFSGTLREVSFTTQGRSAAPCLWVSSL